VDKNVAPNSRGSVSFLNGNHGDIDFINNVFVALNGAELVDGPVSLAKSQFANNAYWTDGAPISIGDSIFASIAAWAETTQQETLNSEFVGIQADPQFGPHGDFRLDSTSPLINAGLSADSSAWPIWWEGLGQNDLYNVSVPQDSVADIGAVEYVQLPGDYNLDGIVNAADYVLWRKLSLQAAQYLTWQTNYGLTVNSLGTGGGVSQGVPEPQVLTTVIMATGFLVAGRHRRSRRATAV